MWLGLYTTTYYIIILYVYIYNLYGYGAVHCVVWCVRFALLRVFTWASQETILSSIIPVSAMGCGGLVNFSRPNENFTKTGTALPHATQIPSSSFWGVS